MLRNSLIRTKITNRNLIIDNWFPSILLAASLAKNKLWLVLCIQTSQNSQLVWLLMREKLKEIVRFCLVNIILVSYKSKKNSVMCIVSTMGQDKSLLLSTKKPVIVEQSNEGRGRFFWSNEQCYVLLKKNKKLCPMCIFYGILNSTAINIYNLPESQQDD